VIDRALMKKAWIVAFAQMVMAVRISAIDYRAVARK
jgi:hypothetical protein